MARFYRKDIARNIISVACQPEPGGKVEPYSFCYSVPSTLKVVKLLQKGGSDLFFIYRFDFDIKTKKLVITDTQKGVIKSESVILNVDELVDHMERYYFTVCGTKNEEKKGV